MKRAECNSFLPILFLIPLIIWFLGWKFAHFVPTSIRPDINVSTLPKIERALFGSSLLYHVFPSHEALVIFSVPPYLIHFTLPFVFGAYLYLIGGRLMCFFICFGLLNFGAIITQFGFPTAPPWYYAKYGEEPASYDMPGDPGRFAMLDERLEMKFFDSMYKSNPVVFGAFPSLHAAWPFLIAAYFPFFAPSTHSSANVLGQILHLILSRVRWIYVGWIWFAAVYTTHHFFVDIMGGVIYTMIAASAVKLTLGGKLGERLDHFAHDVIDNILRRLKTAALLVAGIYLTRKRVRSAELSV